MTASRSHDETAIYLLKADSDFAAVYLVAAVDEADQPGAQRALLSALRHISGARGMRGTDECARTG